jgi:probable F420-dependent oxidoreductase
MTGRFRFGVQGGPFDDPAELTAYARHVEALGYDELFTADHVGDGSPDPFVPLVVAALATERLRVGPLVLNNEFHNPVLLARTAATVDRMSGGRLVLGLGTGYEASEHIAIGAPIRPPGPRVARFGESLDVLRRLLDGGSVTHNGEQISIDLRDLGIRPVQPHVPFLIGGHGRRVVELAGAWADIFQFTGLVHGPDGTPTGAGFPLGEVIERARWLAEAAGDREVERSVLVQFAHVGDDAPSASQLSERFGHEADVIEDTPFALFGSQEQVVDKIERLRAGLGISHVVVRDPDGFAPVVDALRGR